jgi:hypothetical protein
MKMLRSGGAASRSVIEERPGGAEVSYQLEEGVDMLTNGLAAMVQMGDGQVRRENRHGIAEDKVITSVKDPFLTLREMIDTQETRSIPDSCFVHVGCTALHPPGIVLESDRESGAVQIPLPAALQALVTFTKFLPGISLLRQEFETKSG